MCFCSFCVCLTAFCVCLTVKVLRFCPSLLDGQSNLCRVNDFTASRVVHLFPVNLFSFWPKFLAILLICFLPLCSFFSCHFAHLFLAILPIWFLPFCSFVSCHSVHLFPVHFVSCHFDHMFLVFLIRWWRGNHNSCSRTDLEFRPKTDSNYARKKEQSEKRKSASASASAASASSALASHHGSYPPSQSSHHHSHHHHHLSHHGTKNAADSPVKHLPGRK